MDKTTLRKVQLVQLEIAKEIARVCNLNNINYFLIGGTLLGAVRHKGFIPWDDDLDIGMLRNDYEKFISIAPQCINEKYKVVDWKSDTNYPHPMGKVIKKGTIYKESKRNDLGEQGIWVDIFPYDNVENIDALVKRDFKLKMLRSLIRAKNNYQTWISQDGFLVGKYIKNLPFRIISVFFNRENLISKYELLSTKDNGIKTEYVFENGTEEYTKWVFLKEYFLNLNDIEFEDAKFTGPERFDDYLTVAYGNYMKLPPESERENRHLIEEIYLGEDL